MYQLIMIFHVLAAACIIALVLVQQGKGATAGAGFGSGASQTVFGSRGSGSFLLKVTIGFVAIFFLTSIALNRIAVSAVRAQQQPEASLPVLPGEPSQNSNTISPDSIPSSMTKPAQVPAGTGK